MVIRTVTSAGAGLAIAGAVLQIGRQGALKMRHQRGKFWLSSPRHRPSTPGTLGNLLCSKALVLPIYVSIAAIAMAGLPWALNGEQGLQPAPVRLGDAPSGK
jgi:hypothetical protein